MSIFEHFDDKKIEFLEVFITFFLCYGDILYGCSFFVCVFRMLVYSSLLM